MGFPRFQGHLSCLNGPLRAPPLRPGWDRERARVEPGEEGSISISLLPLIAVLSFIDGFQHLSTCGRFVYCALIKPHLFTFVYRWNCFQPLLSRFTTFLCHSKRVFSHNSRHFFLLFSPSFEFFPEVGLFSLIEGNNSYEKLCLVPTNEMKKKEN